VVVEPAVGAAVLAGLAASLVFATFAPEAATALTTAAGGTTAASDDAASADDA
jgi:hypothetical protein